MQTPPAAPALSLPPRVRREAIEWLVELQSDEVTPDSRARWQEWLAAHPDHERAWQCVESFGARLRGLPSTLAHAALAAPDKLHRRQVLKSLAALAFTAGGAAWVLRENAPLRSWMADHRTGTGERADLALPDGTRVQLNTASAVNVRFSGSERVLRLVEGEILVTTAHEPAAAGGTARPFIVQTAHGRIRALGTRFTVRSPWHGADDNSIVAVYEGAVELQPRSAIVPPVVLQAGEQGQLTRTGHKVTGRADENATAWTDGMIVAQDMPLGEFLAQLEQHRPGRLACEASVAKLKVTGTYPLADTDRILTALATTLPVKIRSVTRYWVTVQPI